MFIIHTKWHGWSAANGKLKKVLGDCIFNPQVCRGHLYLQYVVEEFKVLSNFISLSSSNGLKRSLDNQQCKSLYLPAVPTYAVVHKTTTR